MPKLQVSLFGRQYRLHKRWPLVRVGHHYRMLSRNLAELGPQLSAETTWRAVETPTPGGEVARIFDQSVDIHKFRHYLPIYESILPSTPIRMLEIGVDRGGSLQMWRRYLHPESIIVGIDINQDAKRFDDPDTQIHVRIGSQNDLDFLKAVIDEFGPFDVVLDDGSHMASHMVSTFQFLFPEGVKPGGCYVVEDICASYWTYYRDQSTSFIDFTKHLMDVMYAHYLSMPSLELNIRENGPEQLSQIRVPLATKILDKIELHDSIAVFHRASDGRGLPRSVYR